ncbi:MAG: PD-(D/E)XK nuclease family protein, partial [Thermoguttaceae bacterium]|nr:PD-(D/E)XK nuclease family protein [Thermoguttaceae bacterium]
PVWQEILDELPKVVTFGDDPPNMDSSVKEYLDETKEVIQLEGNSQAELARHLVRYLTAAKNSEKLSSITLLACGDTRVLDGTLHKGGFGAVGNVSPSAGRPSQALLTLFFSVMWEPIRVEQLYELIASPYLGIPNKDLIRKAIENAPGVGSEEWIKAWKKVLADNNAKVFDKLQGWLENPLVPLVPPEENASAEQRLEHSKQVIERLEELEKRRKWLYNRLNRRNKKDDLIHPELGTTISALRSLESVLDEYKQSTENITLIQLTRAIESLIGSGTPPASAEQEVTEFKIATNPGMVESTETLLWFDCVRSDPPRPTRWSKSERQYFKTANIVTDTAERRRKLDAYYRKRAFKKIKQRIIFFIPDTIDGEEANRATFLNEVDLALGEDKAEKSKLKAESLITDAKEDKVKWELADQHLTHTRIREWSYDTGILDAANTDAKITPRLFTIKNLNIGDDYRFSYSQLSNLLRCPMRWVIENYLALRDYVPVQLGDQSVKGKLAHDILEELVRDRESWDPEEARKLSGERFDERVKERGGALNNKENEIERKNLRR